jgi:hypothetical protein
MTLQLGGGLLAGAALLGGGYYAWHEHEKKKTEEEVSFLPHYSDFALTYHRRRNKPSRGVLRDGSVMLMRAPRSSATRVLVPPRPGFLLRDVTRSLAQPYRPERTKITIRSISHGRITKIASVRSVD